MLDQKEPLLAVNDQEEVARMRHDCDKNLSDLLHEFGTVRSTSTAFLSRLEPQRRPTTRRSFNPRT